MHSGTVILLLSRRDSAQTYFYFFVSLLRSLRFLLRFILSTNIRFKRKRQKHLGRGKTRKRDVYNILRLEWNKHISIIKRSLNKTVLKLSTLHILRSRTVVTWVMVKLSAAVRCSLLYIILLDKLTYIVYKKVPNRLSPNIAFSLVF